jgi:DNA polymerase III subunit alpha
MFLIFDTETTGLPRNWNAPLTDLDNWPRLVQLAWQAHDKEGKLLEVESHIIRPEGFEIPFNAEKVHGISTAKALAEGIPLKEVLGKFKATLDRSTHIVGHNIGFDINIMAVEYIRVYGQNILENKPFICTKEEGTDFCALPGGKGGKFKWPSLSELHRKLFNEGFEEAHNASADVVATARCFLELIRLDVLSMKSLGMTAEERDRFKTLNPSAVRPVEIKIEPNTETTGEKDKGKAMAAPVPKANVQGSPFVHLHVHTQYSILDGAASVKGLIAKAKEDGMVGLAITDHGNMFGAKDFYNTALKNGIKPIIGCEVYVARRSMADKSDKIDGGGHHLILLAKNHQGYKNLLKLVSYSYMEGMYYKPRVDKTLLRKYNEGLIASSACLGGEVSRTLMDHGVEQAEKVILEYKEIFGQDYYLELQRHPSGDPKMDSDVYERQVFVNQKLIELGKKLGVKLVATNDVHFINAGDAGAHDRLVCLSTQSEIDDENRLRYTRQEWLKTQKEMKSLFADVPEALQNTYEVFEKIGDYELNSPPILPAFPLPEGFEDEDAYLKHLTFEGAQNRWGALSDDVKERIGFELETIKKWDSRAISSLCRILLPLPAKWALPWGREGVPRQARP